MPRHRVLAAFAALCALLVVTRAPAAPEDPPGGHGPLAEGGATTATPAGRKVSVRVGEPVTFATSLAGGATARWRLDGAPAGSGSTWTFTPASADVGRHVVEVEVSGAGVAPHRRWDVRVTPPRLPRVAAASPAADTVTVEVDRDVVLRFDVRPGTPGESVRVQWSVDGAPAGEGDTLRWRATEPANVRARALAVGSLGAAIGHEWRILVRLPTTITTPPLQAEAKGVEPMGPLPPSRPETARREDDDEAAAAAEPDEATDRADAQETARAREDEPVPVTSTTAPPAVITTSTVPPPPVVTTSTVPPPAVEAAPPREVARAEPPREEPPPPPSPPPPPPPPAVASRGSEAPSSGGADDEVRRLLERYAAAWRNHDVEELRRIGQVNNDKQAADMARYFAKVEDLDVEVNVLDIRTDGDRATVRFTRRDRFRDPAGRVVTQESPPIEKRVVRSADGMRFEAATR